MYVIYLKYSISKMGTCSFYVRASMLHFIFGSKSPSVKMFKSILSFENPIYCRRVAYLYYYRCSLQAVGLLVWLPL